MPEAESAGARRLPQAALVDPRRGRDRRPRRRARRGARADRRSVDQGSAAARDRTSARPSILRGSSTTRSCSGTTERAVLHLVGRAATAQRSRQHAQRLGAWAAFYIPRAPNAPRRRAKRGPRPPTRRSREPGSDAPARHLRRRGARRPERARARRAAPSVLVFAHVRAARSRGSPTSSCPATSYLERDGTLRQPRGARSSGCAAP